MYALFEGNYGPTSSALYSSTDFLPKHTSQIPTIQHLGWQLGSQLNTRTGLHAEILIPYPQRSHRNYPYLGMELACIFGCSDVTLTLLTHQMDFSWVLLGSWRSEHSTYIECNHPRVCRPGPKTKDMPYLERVSSMSPRQFFGETFFIEFPSTNQIQELPNPPYTVLDLRKIGTSCTLWIELSALLPASNYGDSMNQATGTAPAAGGTLTGTEARRVWGRG